MIVQYTFDADAKAVALCDEIVEEMARLFGISREEAVGRINRHWSGQSIRGDLDMVYHEDAEFWAKQIYYDPQSFWWMTDNPTVLPYP